MVEVPTLLRSSPGESFCSLCLNYAKMPVASFAAGKDVGEAVGAVCEMKHIYHALRGPNTQGLLSAVGAAGVAPRDAPPSRQLDSVRESECMQT